MVRSGTGFLSAMFSTVLPSVSPRNGWSPVAIT